MRSTVLQDFRLRVELFLERHSATVTQTRFGEMSLNDGSFVADLRDGSREFRISTIERVDRWMIDFEAMASREVAQPKRNSASA